MLSALVAPTSQLSNLQNCDITEPTACPGPSSPTPTGTVTFTDNGSTINTAVINAEGDAEYNAPFAVGAHSVTATYNGDQSYNKVTATAAIPFTVVKDHAEYRMRPARISTVPTARIIGPDQPTVLTVIVENGAQYNANDTTGHASPPFRRSAHRHRHPHPASPPASRARATLSAGVDPSPGGRRPWPASAHFTLPSPSTSGNYNVTITYSGDANYDGAHGAKAPVTIRHSGRSNGDGHQTSVTTATSRQAISPNSTITVTGTVTGPAGTRRPPAASSFHLRLLHSPRVGLSSRHREMPPTSPSVQQPGSLQGSNFITLQYSGDTHLLAVGIHAERRRSPSPSRSLTSRWCPDTTIVPVSISARSQQRQPTPSTSPRSTALPARSTSPARQPRPSPAPFRPIPALSNQSSTTATLTINVPAGTANGNYNVLVTGKDAATGEFIHTLAITADVTGSHSRLRADQQRQHHRGSGRDHR